MSDWLITVAARIRRAIGNITDAGYRVYAPLCRERSSGGFKDRFLFGRYLLVQRLGKWPIQFHHLTNTVGVRTVLKYDDERPLLVRSSEVMSLRARENKRGYIATPPDFIPQQRVLITRGSFMDHLARYISEQGAADRVEIECLGQVLTLALPMGSLIAA